MGKGGIGKGSPFERKIAKELSVWLRGVDSGIWRTKGSGGRGTCRRKKDIIDPYDLGDLTFDHPEGKPLIDVFMFELKKGRGKELDILSIVDGKLSKKVPAIIQWWRKADEERAAAERSWTQLIIERDRKDAIVVVNASLYYPLVARGLLRVGNILRIVYEEIDVVALKMSEFYSDVRPSHLGEIKELGNKKGLEK